MERSNIKLLLGSFIYGCTDTAVRSIIILPKGASIFKRLGKFFLSEYVADKVSGQYCRYFDDIADYIDSVKEKLNAENKEDEDAE